MAKPLLFLGLILMGALKIQAQESVPTVTPKSPLRKFPLHPDFQYDKGKWYTIGWAQNTLQSQISSEIALRSTIYKLNNDHSYNIISAWLNKQQCVYKIEMMFPTNLSGLFSLENTPGRTKELSLELKQHYHNVTRSLGLTDDNIIYMDPRGVCGMKNWRFNQYHLQDPKPKEPASY
nr:neutrophil gelatinase-associated lipocalin-like [Cavia porcellus]